MKKKSGSRWQINGIPSKSNREVERAYSSSFCEREDDLVRKETKKKTEQDIEIEFQENVCSPK